VLYDIRLVIAYDYDRPAGAGRNMLRLMPADLPGEQRRLSGKLVILPAPAERRDIMDFFGNSAVEIAFREAHEDIRFNVEARVERIADASGLDISPPLDRLAAEISGHRGLDADSPHHFLGASPRIPVTREMTAYGRDHVTREMTAREAVVAVGRALNADFTYDPDATGVETTPGEAFALRRGVCQDFSQVMISALRGIGVPAGYVSGFLRTIPPPGKPRLEGSDAMHAWVRAWCGWDAGWIEYDPTNALMVGPDHVVVARGRDYGDVAPVKGVLRTAGGQTSDQAVDVLPVSA
jgi:transglutaminase-like putative cysteine protease